MAAIHIGMPTAPLWQDAPGQAGPGQAAPPPMGPPPVGMSPMEASQAADVTSANLGYPEDSTLFYPVLLYKHGFTDFQMGYASAMAMLLLAVAFAVTLVILLNSRRWVHYAGAVR